MRGKKKGLYLQPLWEGILISERSGSKKNKVEIVCKSEIVTIFAIPKRTEGDTGGRRGEKQKGGVGIKPVRVEIVKAKVL